MEGAPATVGGVGAQVGEGPASPAALWLGADLEGPSVPF